MPGFPWQWAATISVRAAGLVDDRADLLVGELLMDRMVHLAHHSARRADLDHLRPEAQLVPHAAEAFRDAIAHLEIPSGV